MQYSFPDGVWDENEREEHSAPEVSLMPKVPEHDGCVTPLLETVSEGVEPPECLVAEEPMVARAGDGSGGGPGASAAGVSKRGCWQAKATSLGKIGGSIAVS
jgi:hypothetical protein